MENNYCSTSGKKRFATVGDAKSVLTKPAIPPRVDGRRVKRRMNKRKETRSYYCSDCNGYHLTSKDFYKEKRK